MQFDNPYGVAVDPASDGYIYVTDFNNHRLQIFTKDGKFKAVVGKSGKGKGEFGHPSGVAVDTTKDGLLYVVEYGNHRMQSFNKRTFAYVAMVGKNGGAEGDHGNGDSEFGSPVGVAVDSSDAGLLYVVDNTNHRIQIFGKDGTYKSKYVRQHR